jgi:serine/threonine protein kinase
MGVIFFQMLYGRVPLEAKSLEELISKAKKNEIHFPYQLVTPTLRELLEAMLQCDPKNRISWKEIFALKLFAGKEKVETGLTHTIKSVENNLEAMLKESEMYFDTKKTILEIEMPITVEAPPFEKV